MTPQELKQEFGQLSEQFIERVKTQAAEAAKGAVDPVLADSIKKMNEKLDQLETKYNRPFLFGANQQMSREAKAERTAEYLTFNKFLKAGKKSALTPDEQKMVQVGNLEAGPKEVKLLTETDDTTGGVLAPSEFVQEIIKGVILYSPMRGLCRTRTTAMRSVKVPKRTGTFAASWTGEVSTRTETTGLTYGLEEVPVHELYALADISNADLEDSAFDLNAELQMEFSEQFAKAEGAAFVSGDMIGKPEGFLSNAAVAYVAGTDASALKYAGFNNLAHTLKTAYAANAVWLMNRQTLGLARGILDGSSRPIWQPFGESGMAGANPSTILGLPYQEMPDMPDVASNAYPVALGDWRRAYLIIDRIALEIQRDPYTQNTKGVCRFVARRRTGGQVVLADAVKKMKIATS